VFEKRRIIRSRERLLNTNQEGLEEAIRQLRERIEKLEEDIRKYEERVFTHNLDNLISNSIDVGGYRLLVSEVSAADVPELRRKMDLIRDRSRDLLILLYARIKEKISIVMSVPKEMTDRIDASLVIKEVSKSVGGTGGGRKDMAQGGGTDLSRIDTIKDTAVKAIRNILTA
jgi:alanyl-tRNA synthetase